MSRLHDGNPAAASSPRAGDTRERLISLAATMFAEEGYASASVRDLAARSGMTSGAIYGNFKGKADLLVAAVDARLSTDLEDPPPGLDGVTEVSIYHWAHHDERETLRALLLEGAVAARADDEVREHLSETLAPRIDRWTAAFERWRSSAELDEGIDPRALVLLLVGADLGVGVLTALGIESPPPEAWTELIRSVLAGLATPPAEGTKSARPATARSRARKKS